MATTRTNDIWTLEHVGKFAPDEASLKAAREVLRRGGFGTVEPTGDGRGWWVVCRGITDTYQVSVRRNGPAFDCACTCPSPKHPCKHALALLLYLVEYPELRTEADAPKATAGDFESLLRAVFRDPDDDTPRLVFADFLEENDQPDRAALIRYQCEQARLRSTLKRYKELTKQINPLVQKFKTQILPLPEALRTVQFRRGFLHLGGEMYGLGDVGALPARFTNLFRDGWVESVRFRGGGSVTSAPGLVSLVVQAGAIDVSERPMGEQELATLVAGTAEERANHRLVRIKVHKSSQKSFDHLLRARRGETVVDTTPTSTGPSVRFFSALTPRTFDLLLRVGRFSGATALTINSQLGDAELAALLTADLSQLQDLELEWWALTRTGIEALANASALAHLRTLDLSHCGLAADVAALAAGTGLRELEMLTLTRCALTDDGLEGLARSRSFPKLSRLELNWNDNVTARGAAAILAAKHFPCLAHVNLSDTAIPEPEQIPLILDAPDRAELIGWFPSVSVSRKCADGEVVVEIGWNENRYQHLYDNFAACAGAKRVTRFAARHLVGQGAARAVAALAAGFDPERLSRLDLSDTPLGNAGMTALATGFANFKLRELILRECRIGALGLRAFLGSSLYKAARRLDLSDNNLGAAGVAALLKADVPPTLEELRLTDYGSGYGMGTAQKKQLRAKFGTRLKM